MLGTEAYQKGLARSQELVQQLQSHGQINPVLNPVVVATFWTALVDGLMLHWKIDPDRVDPTALAPALANIL